MRRAGSRRTARGLQLPRGAESLHLEDAYVHHQMVRRIFSLFSSWGYLPLETPVLDFFDVYQPLMEDGAVQQVYRLVDRDGDLLMLRSDITLFMAKQVAVALEGMRLPVRVCYFDTILRHHDSEEMSRNEFYQVGAELVTTAAQLAPPSRFRIDLSEVGSQPYHSGLVFSVYTTGIGTAIAAGGRYDRLLGTFGRAAPAAGFSLLLRTAEPAMEARGEFLPPQEVTEVEHGDFAASYRRAEQIRASGGVAVL